MEPLHDLPDIPQNAALLAFLREQASPPGGPGDFTLGPWQLHTHPDLISRLRELAPGWPLTAAYGVPLLANDGVAALVALGTSWIIVRVELMPTGVQIDEPSPEWSFVTGDWHVIRPWQADLPANEGERALQNLVGSALAYAARLATPS